MKIGIDIIQMAYPGFGVANYTYNLVKNLLLFDKENKYYLFYSSFRRTKGTTEKLKEFKKMGGNLFAYPFPPRVFHFLWMKNHFLPIEWLIGKVDIFFSSDFLRPPLLKGTKGITTIHDLVWKIYPQFHTEDIVFAHEKKMAKTIKYQDIIIVDSENTKKDLIKFYPQVKKNNQVYLLYPGVGESFKPIKNKEKIRRVLKRYHLEYPAINYLLYVGAVEPRKNLETAIKTFAKLIEDKDYSDFKFLIVGKAGWKNENIFQLIKDLRLKKKVIFVGFVKDKDLPYFYNSAKILIYLSKYEGFGLPPLEALSCKTPVLAGKNSSLKEILPNDYLTDLNNNQKILIKLKALLKKNRYIKIESSFSWEDYVKRFLEILKNNFKKN